MHELKINSIKSKGGVGTATILALIHDTPVHNTKGDISDVTAVIGVGAKN